MFPEDNDDRRALVLKKMLELGYINEAEYKEAKNDDVYSRIQEVKKVSDESYEVNTFYEDAIIFAGIGSTFGAISSRFAWAARGGF